VGGGRFPGACSVGGRSGGGVGGWVVGGGGLGVGVGGFALVFKLAVVGGGPVGGGWGLGGVVALFVGVGGGGLGVGDGLSYIIRYAKLSYSQLECNTLLNKTRHVKLQSARIIKIILSKHLTTECR
jgi:hypothetical protein